MNWEIIEEQPGGYRCHACDHEQDFYRALSGESYFEHMQSCICRIVVKCMCCNTTYNWQPHKIQTNTKKHAKTKKHINNGGSINDYMPFRKNHL